MTFQQSHWYLKDLQYTYLNDGYTIVATTDVPCHLFCRMTTTPPHKHAKSTTRRGLNVQWDVRFCFVVYEDNEQTEAGDTLIHTFVKSAWPVCERRWFYFVGNITGIGSPSESPIFTFHFPAPPPEPPPPILHVFNGSVSNRTIRSNHVWWPNCWSGSLLSVRPFYAPPWCILRSSAYLTASFFIHRTFDFFNTSSLPITAKILSAQLSLYFTEKIKTSSIVYPYIYVTRGLQGDPVVTGDWYAQNTETDVLGQIHLDNIIINQYNDIDFNQDGLDHINRFGITRYCIRQEMDVKNKRPPLGVNRSTHHSQQKGAGFRPLLKITYNPA